MSKDKPELPLHEEILMLALRDEKGTVESRAGMYQYAIGGALLSELLLAGCIDVEQTKKKLVNLVKVKRLHDPILDECVELVASAKRRRSAAGWVGRFAHIKRLRHRVAELLCRRGILQESADKVLLIFTRKIYPTIDAGPERRVIQRLRRAVFQDTETVDPRTGILVALANGVGLLTAHFDRKELKQRKQRLEQITNGDLIGGATREAVQAAQAAALAAATAATVATTVATSGS